jgi:hypothetical protein
MRFLVTGGRDFNDNAAIVNALCDLPEDAILIHGDARGADRIAAWYWSGIRQRQSEAYPADWARNGRAAGPIRNQRMLDSGVDLVIAFDGGTGTADMVSRAKKAGVRVLDVMKGEV